MRRLIALTIIVGILTVACHRAVNPTAPTTEPAQQAQAAPGSTEQVQTDTQPTAAVAPAEPNATPKPTPSPYASAMPLPTPPSEIVETYTVRSGDTLSGISLAFDVALEDLIAINNLESENAIINIGQPLRIPLNITRTGPEIVLLPDSEVVYSPGYLGFDVQAFVGAHGGYLARFTSPVNGTHVSGADIVSQIARQNSIGPRVLLALLEHYGSWVTQAQPTSYQSLGPANPYYDETFYLQLSWAANRLSEGYYSYKRSGNYPVRFSDGSRAMVPAGLNAGTAGILNMLAENSEWEAWEAEMEGFLGTYRRLFGDPSTHVFEPVVPDGLAQPALRLPWESGATFYYTGGPHGAFLSGSAWAAVDFAPPDIVGNCYYSQLDITAAADGRLILVDDGEIYLDLDTDGNLETGWVLLYLHVAPNDQVTNGQLVSAGTALGYASCEGGYATSSHLHLARRFNGEWLAADGPVPLVLSGWQFHEGVGQYDGTAERDGVVKTACDCSDDALNAMVSE